MDVGRVTALVERPGVAAQLCVLRDGETVLERSVGVTTDRGRALTFMLNRATATFTSDSTPGGDQSFIGKGYQSVSNVLKKNQDAIALLNYTKTTWPQYTNIIFSDSINI